MYAVHLHITIWILQMMFFIWLIWDLNRFLWSRWLQQDTDEYATPGRRSATDL